MATEAERQLLDGYRARMREALAAGDMDTFSALEERAYDLEKRLRSEAAAPAKEIIGYRRVFDGGCADCRKAATLLYHSATLMPIHEHCNCGVAPVFAGEDHGLTPAPDDIASPDSELGSRLEQPLTKAKSGKKAPPAWKSLPSDELRAYLHEHKTIGDKMWADLAGGAVRAKGESRADFIDRVLGGGPKVPEAAQPAIAPVIEAPTQVAVKSGGGFWEAGPSAHDVLRPADSVLNDEYSEAVRILNTVGLPDGIPELPVVTGDYSGFATTFQMGGDVERYIQLRPGYTADELVHEFGHAIDEIIGKGRKGYKAVKKEVVSLGRDTKSYRAIKGEHAKHDRDPDEVWARAYEQWAVTRAGATRLREIETSYERYWTDEEFEPIASKLDEIFGTEPRAVEKLVDADSIASEAEVEADFREHLDTQTVDDAAAVADYGGKGGVELNEALRTDDMDEDFEAWARDLDAAMRPIGVRTVVHRGLKGSWEDIFGSAPQVGGRITDKGYLSTTHNEALAKKFGAGKSNGVHVEIDVPVGTPSIWMPDMGFGSELAIKRGRTLEIQEVVSPTHIKVRVVEEAEPVPPAHPEMGADDWPALDEETVRANIVEQFPNIDDMFTPDQVDAFQDYIGAPETNFVLRGDTQPNWEHIDKSAFDVPAIEKNIRAIDDAMLPLEQDAIVHRGMGFSFERIFGHPPEVGGIIRDRGFMSTSTDREISGNFGGDGGGVHLEILAPKGTKAVWLGDVAPEEELLLGRDTGLEILEVHVDEDGVQHLKVRVVDQEARTDVLSSVRQFKAKKAVKFERKTVLFASQEFADLKAAGWELKSLNGPKAELQRMID